jgi:hypothetical protein
LRGAQYAQSERGSFLMKRVQWRLSPHDSCGRSPAVFSRGESRMKIQSSHHQLQPTFTASGIKPNYSFVATSAIVRTIHGQSSQGQPKQERTQIADERGCLSTVTKNTHARISGQCTQASGICARVCASQACTLDISCVQQPQIPARPTHLQRHPEVGRQPPWVFPGKIMI